MAAAVRHEEWTVRAAGRPMLHGESWRPAGDSRAAILVVHGLAEHTGRYALTAAALAEAGLSVHAVDCRGHGRSEGLRVHVEDVERYLDDARAGLERARSADPGRPLFALGHSQGGLVVLQMALGEADGLAGVVAVSPFLAVHPHGRPGRARRVIAAMLARIAPRRLFTTRIDATTLSRDLAVGEAYDRDPLVSHAVSAGWARAIARAQRDVRERASRLRVPTLVMVGTDDRLVDAEATRRFAAAAPRGLLDLVEWPAFRHELLNEIGREQVIHTIVRWLEAHLAPASAVSTRRAE